MFFFSFLIYIFHIISITLFSCIVLYRNSNSNFDAAANINQTWYNNFYEQDCMVKQAFRKFVDYIAEVRTIIHNILFVEITKNFRMSAQTNISILISCSNWHWSCIFKPKNIQLRKMHWLAPSCFWLINSNNMKV